jgi:hypothetical protein
MHEWGWAWEGGGCGGSSGVGSGGGVGWGGERGAASISGAPRPWLRGHGPARARRPRRAGATHPEAPAAPARRRAAAAPTQPRRRAANCATPQMRRILTAALNAPAPSHALTTALLGAWRTVAGPPCPNSMLSRAASPAVSSGHRGASFNALARPAALLRAPLARSAAPRGLACSPAPSGLIALHPRAPTTRAMATGATAEAKPEAKVDVKKEFATNPLLAVRRRGARVAPTAAGGRSGAAADRRGAPAAAAPRAARAAPPLVLLRPSHARRRPPAPRAP